MPRRKRKPFGVEVKHLGNAEAGIEPLVYFCYFETEEQAKEYMDAVVFSFCGTSAESIDKVNDKTQKINKKQFNQLKARLALLPSKPLLENVESKDLIRIWACLNFTADYLGRCLSMRIFKQDGDPIKHLLLGTKDDKFIYQLLWGRADFYDSLLSLINFLWEPLNKYLQSQGYFVCSGFHLLLTIISHSFDSTFIRYSRENLKVSPCQNELLFSAASKYLLFSKTPITKKEEKVFETYKELRERDTWIDLILDIYEQEIRKTNNPILKARYRDFIYKTGILCDYGTQSSRYQRKNAAGVFTWENQRHIRI